MSLFQRPSWSQHVGTSLEDGDDDDQDKDQNIFSHSRSFRSVLEDSRKQEKVREEKQLERTRRRKEKQEGRGQRPPSPTKRNSPDDDSDNTIAATEGSDTKRRRISARETASLLRSIGHGNASKTCGKDKKCYDEEDNKEENSNCGETVPLMRSLQYEGKPADDKLVRDSPSTLEYEVEVSDSLEDKELGKTQSITQARNDEQDDEESDPELAELKRKARARHILQASRASTPSTGPDGASNARLDFAPLRDATIQILIDSPLPNTRPIRVFRKLSQRLQEVRQAWCDKQGFSKEYASKVILTHNNRRLFNVTTCRSLGLTADEFGNVVLADDTSKDDVDLVHVEAMTEELFEQRKKEQARASLEASEEGGPQEETATEAATPASHEADDGKYIWVLLKAKDKEVFRLGVLPDTLISKIAKVARRQFDIPHERAVHIKFDGERLDSDSQIKDSEIEDQDSIEVHVE